MLNSDLPNHNSGRSFPLLRVVATDLRCNFLNEISPASDQHERLRTATGVCLLWLDMKPDTFTVLDEVDALLKARTSPTQAS